ncbi:two-component response regulator [Labilithrix luteola]|uniref:Two-component response regulator n=1 Tax=Labilithrix luteola TaxID=1391654 RepID=A0A0K1PZZ6_9BACT|nr:two-component response regulator [Labilithrix luteola]
MTALATVLDLVNGLAPEKSLLTGLFAMDLACELALPDVQRRAAFYAGLLRQLGCTAYAGEWSRLGNDIALRRAILHGDDMSDVHLARSVTRANTSLKGGVTGLARLLSSSRRLRPQWYAASCDAGRILAEGLGFGVEVTRALDEIHERWDGAGGPNGLVGDAASIVGRIGQVAHVAVVFFLDGDVKMARDALELQSGRALDPVLTKLALSLTPLLATLAEGRLEAAEAVLGAAPPPLTAPKLAAAFGDFADLQTPSTVGHSRAVASVCDAVAENVGVTGDDRARLALAARLHDLGQVLVPTGIWLQKTWTAHERDAANTHPMMTERLLSASPMLKDVARLAGAHHERLDGSGYPRNLSASGLSRAERLLAAADVWVGLREPRAHRAAFELSEARRLLQTEAKEGRLDPDCVCALLGAESPDGRPKPRASSDLTSRELEVLRLLARGATNKEIARTLRISDRTVQHHTIHIYQKLGVRSRAGAVLTALKTGLV